jgi:hypothetical protein
MEPIQACPFLKTHGHEVLKCLEDCAPFPSQEHKAQRAGGRGYSYPSNSGSGGFFQFVKSCFSLVTNRSVDNSFRLIDSRTTTNVTIHVSSAVSEKEQQAEAARKKKEAEERRNTQIMVASGIGAGVLGYLSGRFYTKYSEAKDYLEQMQDKQTRLISQIPNLSGMNSQADLDVKQAITVIFAQYRNFYQDRIRKVRVYALVATVLFAEVTVFCLSAFYKAFRLRDNMGVVVFLTGLVGVVLYAVYRDIDSRARWEKKTTDLNSTVGKIRTVVALYYSMPPSYAEAVKVQAAQAFEAAGFLVPKIIDGITYTQKLETREWFWLHTEEQRWVPCASVQLV